MRRVPTEAESSTAPAWFSSVMQDVNVSADAHYESYQVDKLGNLGAPFERTGSSYRRLWSIDTVIEIGPYLALRGPRRDSFYSPIKGESFIRSE
ncbi:hypothetical protein HD806DRAFT_371105 [Xylariaceae sp. AK1471]|nr:hypothetical protein HD806DRAFT_371105 [Xylariaceae sp. AK1471]